MFESVDRLQQTLAETVFVHTKDRKKAAGRALGTLVELITFYTLRSWGFRDEIVIERALPEFGNPEIVHNVEFSLHPVLSKKDKCRIDAGLPLTARKFQREIEQFCDVAKMAATKSQQLVSRKGVIRNACCLIDHDGEIVVANVDELGADHCAVTLCRLHEHPFAIFECKRVGVEEGMRKGPQTIEKAKQGAYVARTVSALQRLRMRDGRTMGLIERANGSICNKPYGALLREIIDGADVDFLSGFILTVGVVSNHGNWFTADNPNKEMKVLSQSYDWLIFLTDDGLAQFIEQVLLRPAKTMERTRNAFLASYTPDKTHNQFTKVRMEQNANDALCRYFDVNQKLIADWFHVIAPRGGKLQGLRSDLLKLRNKDWIKVFKP